MIFFPFYTSFGDSVIIDRVCYAFLITFMGYKTWVDIAILDMVDFDVILMMSWLSTYHAISNFRDKTVILAMSSMFRIEWKGDCSLVPKKYPILNLC